MKKLLTIFKIFGLSLSFLLYSHAEPLRESFCQTLEQISPETIEAILNRIGPKVQDPRVEAAIYSSIKLLQTGENISALQSLITGSSLLLPGAFIAADITGPWDDERLVNIYTSDIDEKITPIQNSNYRSLMRHKNDPKPLQIQVKTFVNPKLNQELKDVALGICLGIYKPGRFSQDAYCGAAGVPELKPLAEGRTLDKPLKSLTISTPKINAYPSLYGLNKARDVVKNCRQTKDLKDYTSFLKDARNLGINVDSFRSEYLAGMYLSMISRGTIHINACGINWDEVINEGVNLDFNDLGYNTTNSELFWWLIHPNLERVNYKVWNCREDQCYQDKTINIEFYRNLAKQKFKEVYGRNPTAELLSWFIPN